MTTKTGTKPRLDVNIGCVSFQIRTCKPSTVKELAHKQQGLSPDCWAQGDVSDRCDIPVTVNVASIQDESSASRQIGR